MTLGTPPSPGAASRPAAGDAVGAVRAFRLEDGSELREQLLSLSDATRELRYCLLASPIPLMGYVARLRLLPVTDGDRTFWEWSSTFETPPGRESELVSLVRDGIYRAGFEAVARRLGRPSSGVSVRPAPPVPTVPVPPVPPSMPPAAASPAGAPRSRLGTARAIVVRRHGGPEVLEAGEVDLPAPGPGEVLIRHGAIGVNFIDVYCRTGYFPLLPLPGVPGMEAAGMVEAVGAGVGGLRPGDRVAYARPPVGAYSEARVMGAEMLVALPPDIDDRTAAASLLKGVSASFLLHEVARVGPGMTVLVHAAAGGIGQILVQWARALGARVIATAGGADKGALVRGLGAELVVDYARDDFAAAARDWTGGRGVDVVFDSAGATTIEGSLAALGVRGHLVSFGQAAGPVGPQDVDRLASRSLTVSRPNYAHYTDTPEALGRNVGRFFDVLRSGTVRLAPPRPYPLDRAADAHRDLEARRTMGALVLIP